LAAGCLLAVCGGWSASAHAQDRILERAYWTDVTGSATLAQAQTAPYTPYTGVLSKGFSTHAQWIRLRIDAVPPGEPDTLVLRIRPVFLDEITLFDPADPAHISMPRTAGDLSPWEPSEFESLHHTFVIPAQPTPRDIWLRLSTASTQLMHVEALSPRDMLRKEHSLWLAYSALLALILSFLVWVLLAWLRDRDPVNGIFVLRQTILLLYTASYLGYHRGLLSDALSPSAQDLMYAWLVLLTTGSSIAFEYRLLREYTLPRWSHWLIRGLLGASALAMGLLVLGQKGEALRLNMLLNAIAPCALLLIASRTQAIDRSTAPPDRYHLPKAALVGYYLAIVLVLAMTVMPSLGLLQGSLLAIYGVLLYGLISGMLMTTLLILRSRKTEQLRLDLANRLFLSREQLAQEALRRKDQSQLLNMLMHELKTPLSVIDMALQGVKADDKTQRYIARAIDNMKSILNRCIQTDRLVERSFTVQREAVDLVHALPQWLQNHQQAAERHVLHSPPHAVVESDRQCIEIIASNLIENALKYGDPQQPIEVSLESQTHADGRAGWCLKVYNPPGAAGWPDADKLFAKYYRSPAAQRQSGTGLGLFLSHNLAQQLNAELRYCPTPTQICLALWMPVSASSS
jgi:signal transduction histidine kinase